MISKVNSQSNVQKPQSTDDTNNKPSVSYTANGNKKTVEVSENELQEVAIEETEKTEEQEALEKVEKNLQKSEKMGASKMEIYQKQIEQMNKQIETLDEQRRSLLKQLAAGGEISNVISTINDINDKRRSALNNITSIILSMEDLQTSLEETRMNAQESIDQINQVIDAKQTAADMQAALTNTAEKITSDSTMADVVVNLGNSFVGLVNSDKEGNRIFSGGKDQAWCADFVTTIVKTACQSTGTAVPSGFGSSSVSGLLEWGKSNGNFIQTVGKSNKAQIIANQVKPGDLLIQKENGISHTGIITKVYPDGSFDTVEGNTKDSVANRHYDANSKSLTGFISMNW